MSATVLCVGAGQHPLAPSGWLSVAVMKDGEPMKIDSAPITKGDTIESAALTLELLAAMLRTMAKTGQKAPGA